jgi:tRNA pseudouridine13 synthase
MEIKRDPSWFIVEEVDENGKLWKASYGIIEKIKDSIFLLKNKKKQAKFLHATLVKNNISTLDAIKIIASKLHKGIKQIGFAGNKDKRALTSQRISIKNVKIENLPIKHKNFFLKNFSLEDKPLSMGMLKGNRFKVKIYLDEKEKEIFENNLENFRRGRLKILNYYDEQRFGKARNNHVIGKAIIKGNYEEAVRLILCSYGEKENEKVKEIKNFIKNNWGDWKSIKEKIKDKKYKTIRPKILNEIGIINSLINNKDYLAALKKLKKKNLLIYVHAYQSFLFNQLIRETRERRIEVDKLPIIGYGTDIEKYKVKEIIKEIMRKEGVRKEEFKIPALNIFEKGSEREFYVNVKDLKVKKEGNFYNLDFFLPKGSYGTMVLKFLSV